jgi:ribosome-binding factor A
MRQYKRSARVNRLLQEEISEIIRDRLKDPRIGMTSIVRVESTEDMRSAKVFVSVLDESDSKGTLTALEKASGLIRHELRHRLSTRRVPELRFFLDRNIAYSVRIAGVLDKLHNDEEDRER